MVELPKQSAMSPSMNQVVPVHVEAGVNMPSLAASAHSYWALRWAVHAEIDPGTRFGVSSEEPAEIKWLTAENAAA